MSNEFNTTVLNNIFCAQKILRVFSFIKEKSGVEDDHEICEIIHSRFDNSTASNMMATESEDMIAPSYDFIYQALWIQEYDKNHIMQKYNEIVKSMALYANEDSYIQTLLNAIGTTISYDVNHLKNKDNNMKISYRISRTIGFIDCLKGYILSDHYKQSINQNIVDLLSNLADYLTYFYTDICDLPNNSIESVQLQYEKLYKEYIKKEEIK